MEVNQDDTTEVTRTQAYRGHYLDNVQRQIMIPDPNNPSRKIPLKKQLQGPTGLVLKRVIGVGKFDFTDEPSITMEGQFAPGQTKRITVSAQNVEPAVKALLKDNVDKSSGFGPNGRVNWPLKVRHVVTAFGNPMGNLDTAKRDFRGLLVQELYLELPDGSTKAIIAAPGQEVDANALINTSADLI